MLQSKSLQPATRPALAHIKQPPHQEVRRIQQQARQVSGAFAELCRSLGAGGPREEVCALARRLEAESLALVHRGERRLGHCQELLMLPGVRRAGIGDRLEETNDHRLVKEQQKLQKLLQDLRVAASRVQGAQLVALVELVTQFGSCLTAVVELLLSRQVEQVVARLAEPASLPELEASLASVTRLGLEGNHLCRLVAHHGGVKLLVALLTSPQWPGARGAALRALGTVCCVLEAIRQLEEERGVEVLARLLGDPGAREGERAEAAGVLAQVTSPWIEENDYILGVTENAFYLVESLTGEPHPVLEAP